MLIVGNHPLLPHAEVFKNIAKYLVCGDFANDVAEVIDALSQILADKVT